MTTEIAEIEITDEALFEFLDSDDSKEHGRCPLCPEDRVGEKVRCYCGHLKKPTEAYKYRKIGSSGKPVCQECLKLHRAHASFHFPNRGE